jgi:hypothetical protein
MNNSHLDRNFSPTCILSSHMVELEYLDEIQKEAIDWTSRREWNMMLWVQQNHKLRLFLWGHRFLVSKG